MFNRAPLIHFYINTIVLSLVFFSLFRLAYWFVFHDANNPMPTNEIINAFYLGLKFDLRLTLLILLPLFLCAWIKPFNPTLSNIARIAWLVYLSSVFATVVFCCIGDFIHYSYLQKPLDASVLRFADDFFISLNMMWQSYPIIWLALSLILITFIYSYILLRTTKPIYENASQHVAKNKLFYKRKWWQQTLFVSACIFLYLFGLFGKFSYYPLRWSDAFASTHPFASAVAVNPVIHLVDTFKNKNINFDLHKTGYYYADVATYLGVNNLTRVNHHTKAFNFTRSYSTAGKLAEKKPNIVIVFLESFASYKTGTFGNKLNPTPNFDKIANNAILFKRFYTPHTGTARSVFAGITGIPDTETNKTSTRNPLIVDQHTVVNAFKDYKKFYFLGGSANWGNIRGLLSHNIKDLNLYEEGSYRSKRVDVWGISDLDLFIEANNVLSKQQEPFFSIIQTSGNHRPYTIPDDNHGFKYIKQSKKTLTDNGFISEKEYNSFRFMDHSIGHFLKDAKREKYFDNTIFIFFGDHGISGYGGKHTPRFKSDFDLTGLHVPLAIYAPKLLKPAQYNKIASEVDLLPTIAGLVTSGYTNTTIGRDLLNTKYDEQRYAFTITHGNNSQLGLVADSYYYKIQADGTQGRLYATDNSILPSDNKINPNRYTDVSPQHPELAGKFKRLTLGIYETSKYMLYHNKPIKD